MRSIKILELRFCRCYLPVALIFLALQTCAQKSNAINLLEFKYGFHFPAGDLEDRFGSNSDIGVSLQSVRVKSKIFYGVEGFYMFGNTVKEDVLVMLRTYDGSIISIDGEPGDVSLKERGFYIGLNAGKIFSLSSIENNMTGIRAQLGAGLLQHKIRVQDNASSVVALEKQYLSGYDRLSNGPAFHLGLGFQYQSPHNNFHVHLMGDLYGAQTESRRDLDYATGEYLNQKNTDLLAGFSLAYIVMISRRSKPEHIYY